MPFKGDYRQCTILEAIVRHPDRMGFQAEKCRTQDNKWETVHYHKAHRCPKISNLDRKVVEGIIERLNKSLEKKDHSL